MAEQVEMSEAIMKAVAEATRIVTQNNGGDAIKNSRKTNEGPS